MDALFDTLIPAFFLVSRASSACSWLGARSAYRIVMVSPLWPSSFATRSRGTPSYTSQLANVWRRSCHLKFSIPAARRAGLKQ
jgi:hypothetical protein